MADSREEQASFGFREVEPREKTRLVRGVFSSVAERYDLMNDLMSAGVHRIWKSVFLTRANPQPGELLVDVAGGTGDVAIGFLKRADSRPQAERRDPAAAILLDINIDMLEAGRKREGAKHFGARLRRVVGDAEGLPLPERCADAYTIAFGIRNVTRIEAALEEARRVLKPGGRFFCLEFSHPITDGLQKLYDAYSFNVLPRLGRLVADDEDSYRYLVESIRRFPAQDAFARMIGRAGFARVRHENLSAGVVAIHSAWRI